MSRIGKAPIIKPTEVTATIAGRQVVVKGPKGEISFLVPGEIEVKEELGNLLIINPSKDKKNQALHGLVRATLANQITGVTKGWTKVLELSGVGFRGALNGVNLTLNIGFSHPVTVVPPAGITFAINEGKIVVSGIDKQLVGEVAAKIRAIKEPEPYKGKGIKYQGEYIRKKAGKAKAAGATGAK